MVLTCKTYPKNNNLNNSQTGDHQFEAKLGVYIFRGVPWIGLRGGKEQTIEGATRIEWHVFLSKYILKRNKISLKHVTDFQILMFYIWHRFL